MAEAVEVVTLETEVVVLTVENPDTCQENVLSREWYDPICILK